MARSNQYSPNQAGIDALKFCAEARATLIARIPKVAIADTPEYVAYVESIVAIRNMDDNELRKALRAAQDPITQYYTDRANSGQAALTAQRP